MKLKMILSMLPVCLLASGLSFAGFEEGLAAYKKGDFSSALHNWKPLAEQGNANAQYKVGTMYDMGQGVPQNYKEAAAWYRKAATQGNVNAQMSLGFMYLTGLGLYQNYKEAVTLYRKAAAQGDAHAQTVLASLYDDGQGLPKLTVVAYALYNLSAAGESSDNTGNAANNCARLAKSMTNREIEAAQALTLELAKPGNLLKALDQFVTHLVIQESPKY